MKTKLFFLSMLLAAAPALAQSIDKEMLDPKPAPAEAWSNVNKPAFGWGDIDTRYALNAVPKLSKNHSVYAWRGERVGAQAVLLAPNAVASFGVKVSDLSCGKNTIPATAIRTYFVRYVMSDYMHTKADSCLMADRLEPATHTMALDAKSLRPVWLDIRVPQSAQPGKYKGTLTATCDGSEMSIPFTVEVGKRVLPEPSKWKFHLDLWQNPFSVARHYGVQLWSKEHFDLMRPVMTMLAEAGQKIITTSIIKQPWNGQTEHPFESMIGKTKCIDGTWKYNYKVFDMWVEFMHSCGITKQIDCYTIVPWHLKFEYFDEAENCTYQPTLQPGTKEYEDYLYPFLKDFAAHLRQKGWFGKTCIAMDERPKELLEPAYEVLFKADKDWKVKGAVNYFGPEVAERMYDISFMYEHPILEKEKVDAHHANGKLMTYYTCCGPARPNTFVFSNPAESTFLAWHAASAGYDGYLRWAYNSWVKNVNVDARFRTWPAGDCFTVYPGGSSIRMERLVEGIQDYEKIMILRSELSGKKLERLNAAVQAFDIIPVTAEADIEALVHAGKAAIRAVE